MTGNTLRNYIKETNDSVVRNGVDWLYKRIGVALEHYRNNKGISLKDFYYIGLMDGSYMHYLSMDARKNPFDVSHTIGSPLKIYDYCYKRLSLNPGVVRQTAVSMYGEVEQGHKPAQDPDFYNKLYFN